MNEFIITFRECLEACLIVGIIYTLLEKNNLKKEIINNVLILEIDEYGILKNKKVKNVKDMNKIKFSSNKTDNTYQKQSFVHDFL